jgi:NADH dehydrogenase FAD-containing subunit
LTNGYKVDEHFEVPGLKGVYAIGDVATYPYGGSDVRIEHWNVAQNAGRQVARDITGKSGLFHRY